MRTIIMVTISATLLLSFWAMGQEAGFKSAKPVWLEGKEKEKNITVGLRAVIESPANEKVVLRIAASTLYRAFVNGAFCAHGPARGPHGWFRVDEWDLTSKLAQGPNVIAIEVAGYNASSFYLLDQPSFVQAEIVAGERVLAATGDAASSFSARLVTERLQKVERYSFQRPFSEVYRLKPEWDAWRNDPKRPMEPVSVAVVESRKLLPRRVPCPAFTVRPAVKEVCAGRLEKRPAEFKPVKNWGLEAVNSNIGGFPEGELETIPSIDIQWYEDADSNGTDRLLTPNESFAVGNKQFVIVDFGVNLTGFIGATIECREPTKVFLTFDEVLSEKGDVNERRLSCANVLTYELAPGRYVTESFEPYTLRYLKVFTLDGACEVSGLCLREYVHPETTEATFVASDERLNRIFAAGVETFRQNAVDIFMDCPSRERAGWLCDSFFTARAAKDITGNTLVEKNFIENFRMPDRYPHLPEGMLPMCYPSDHNDGAFIPNWAMWFVLQLEEYSKRSGDREMVDGLKGKVSSLLDFFKKLENSDGLLEKLPSWVFVEWSEANKFVQDVNYPSNMLYAAVLASAGRMYGRDDLLEKAEKTRQTIAKQSYDGEFFVDNALRKDGKLEVTRNRTEVCQYFAFFFDVATPATYPELWAKLRDQFGPKRKETKAFPEIHPANSFVGNMLRIEILSRYGYCQQILDESIDYLLYMVERTGTLWENVDAAASCNHGFASHIVHTLYRDILGLYSIDTVNKKIRVRFRDVAMPACKGSVPTPDGPVSMHWTVEGDTLRYDVDAPAGYTVEKDIPAGKKLR